MPYLSITDELIFLIYFLYFINCIRIIDKDVILLIYNYKKVNINTHNYFKIDQQKVAYLNPLKFYMPTFVVNKRESNILKEIVLYSKKLRKLLPIAILLWAVILLLLPLSLYFKQELLLVITLGLLYLFILVLSIVIWINKDEYKITKKRVLMLIFDYFLAPPFAINVIRDLSLKSNIKKKYG